MFAREPLPKDSPLWGMKNVIVTPHMAGNPGDFSTLIVGIFKENYRRFAGDLSMINVVNISKGY